MRVISSNEFSANQEKYFNLAVNEDVCINRGNNVFRLMYTPFETQHTEQIVFEPDDDFYRSITMDEFIERAVIRLEKIDKIYSKK